MPQKPQLTRKPIPKDPKKWSNEVKGIERLLNNMKQGKIDEGPAWGSKLKAYYETRLKDLKNHQPDKPATPDNKQAARKVKTIRKKAKPK